MRLADQLMPEEASPAIRTHTAYGYRLLGQREDAKRVWKRIEETIGDRFVDPLLWVWGYLALGEPSRALESLREAVAKPEFHQEIFLHTFIKQNSWADPVLDQPEFVELRTQLGFRA